MITRTNGHKALTLSAHQLKGKNANAVLQSELLQLGPDDTIKLPDDREARRLALEELKNLNTETVKILVHKSKCCGYNARDILQRVKWDDTSLNALAESKEGSGLICEWYNNTGTYMGEKILPTILDDLALKAALTFTTTKESSSRFGSETRAEEILKKFIDKIDLIKMAKNLECARTVCRLAINTNSKELITILNNIYETAIETNNLHALKDLACLNLNTGPVCYENDAAIKVHLGLIQKIITMPEMISKDKDTSYSVDYSGMIECIHKNYRVGFSLMILGSNIERPF
jgi:hypothetical protein